LAHAGRLARTRVIVMSSRGEADLRDALAAGAVDHLAKPFAMPVLMQRVRRALESAAASAPPRGREAEQ